MPTNLNPLNSGPKFAAWLFLGGCLWLLFGPFPLFGQTPAITPEEAKWKQDVQTVWNELTQARQRRFVPPADGAQLSASEVKKLDADLKALEFKLDQLAQTGGEKKFQITLTEVVPLPEVDFPGVPKNEGILGGVNPNRPPPPPSKDKEGDALGKQNEGVLRGNPVFRITPAYPEIARKLRVSGDVQVEVIISKTGKVIQGRCINGHPLFHKLALSAAGQWRFQPTVLIVKSQSMPVNVSAVFTLRFVL